MRRFVIAHTTALILIAITLLHVRPLLGDGDSPATEPASQSTDLSNASSAVLQKQIEMLRNENAMLQAQVARLKHAVLSSEEISERQAAELATARRDLDAMTRRAHELNDALTDAVAENHARDVGDRQAQEEIKELIDELNKTKHGSTTEPAATAPVLDVNGVVVEAIQNVVTINVGSAEGVVPKMQLNVVKDGTFIGILTITGVDAHRAVGRLQGPKVSTYDIDIKGAEVKSKL